MTTTIELTNEEIEEIKALTNQSDVATAIQLAMTEYLQYARRQRLKTLSGVTEMQDNWRQLERLEVSPSHEGPTPGPR